MRLLLLRHAEPTLAGRFIGTLDPPLSERGRMEAAAKLAEVRVDHVLSSPRRRARETAAFIDAPLTIVEDLAEIGFGDWEGLTWAEIEARDPEIAAAKLADWLSAPTPNGESFDALLERVARGLDLLRARPHERIAVVGHVVTNAALHHLLTGDKPLGFRQAYLDIREYEI